jgi:hypothetical protein
VPTAGAETLPPPRRRHLYRPRLSRQ